jgi:hypothetical protein
MRYGARRLLTLLVCTLAALVLFTAATPGLAGANPAPNMKWSVVKNLSQTPLSVSCATPTFCVAVNNYEVGVNVGLGYVYKGSSWSKGTQINPQRTSYGVSCSLRTFCVVTDQLGDEYIFRGSKWPYSGETIDPAGNAFGPVSCAKHFCAAVDGLGNVVTYDGSHWSQAQTIDPTGSDPGLISVSCATSHFCVAADGSGNVLTYDGSTWSNPMELDPRLTTGIAGSLTIMVSCPSTRFCMAVDSSLNAYVFNGSNWSTVPNIDVPKYTPDSPSITSLSCAISTFCVAVGPVPFTYNGSHWSYSTSTKSQDMNSVSCPRPNFCMAVTLKGDAVIGRAR